MEYDKEDGEMSDDIEMQANDVKDTLVDDENKCTVVCSSIDLLFTLKFSFYM